MTRKPHDLLHIQTSFSRFLFGGREGRKGKENRTATLLRSIYLVDFGEHIFNYRTLCIWWLMGSRYSGNLALSSLFSEVTPSFRFPCHVLVHLTLRFWSLSPNP